MGAADPVVGSGAGTFARTWTLERRLDELYILQPHSLELELYSELGAVGVALFLVFVALVVAAAVRARARLTGAAAAAVLVALVAQASVDWTWSFAAIVAGGMLAVGALVGGPARRRAPLPARVAVPLGCAVAVLAVAAPYLAHQQLASATSEQASDPTAAWLAADDALRLDPWNADALALQGLLAESSGRYRIAAGRYALAARVSQRPWLQWVREARALRSGGAIASSRAACRRAILGNPGEWRLRHEPPCEGVAVPGPS
jgi:O-antigen ligase